MKCYYYIRLAGLFVQHPSRREKFLVFLCAPHTDSDYSISLTDVTRLEQITVIKVTVKR